VRTRAQTRTIEKDAMRQIRVLIIGGGAAGLSAAIASARLGAAVTILEAGARVGRKILASGNGRCNLSNARVQPSAYNDPAFVTPVLAAYPCDTVRSFFADIGLLTYADEDGRIYPTTNAANSVLDVLRLECARLGVDERCGFEVARISPESGSPGFAVTASDGETLRADSVVLTTGGGSALLAGVGHDMVPTVPVLGPVRTDAEPIRGLSGVRVKCAATLVSGTGDALATERGELLFRDYGVSGIMVFDLSRALEPGCVISIDLFPDITPSDLEALIAQRCSALRSRTAQTFFVGMLHDRVARAILRAAHVSLDTPAEDLPHAQLARLLKEFQLPVVGMGDPKQAQVSRGGASVSQFDPITIESRLAPGLFAAGEVLDVDGRCGGYNLHWAWASGIVAGESAARIPAGPIAGPDRSTGSHA
jgi:predicted Rossmann fold flavoprotein